MSIRQKAIVALIGLSLICQAGAKRLVDSMNKPKVLDK